MNTKKKSYFVNTWPQIAEILHIWLWSVTQMFRSRARVSALPYDVIWEDMINAASFVLISKVFCELRPNAAQITIDECKHLLVMLFYGLMIVFFFNPNSVNLYTCSRWQCPHCLGKFKGDKRSAASGVHWDNRKQVIRNNDLASNRATKATEIFILNYVWVSCAF